MHTHHRMEGQRCSNAADRALSHYWHQSSLKTLAPLLLILKGIESMTSHHLRCLSRDQSSPQVRSPLTISVT